MYEFIPDTVFITDKTLERSNGREEDFILAHDLGGFSPGWLDRQSCMHGVGNTTGTSGCGPGDGDFGQSRA